MMLKMFGALIWGGSLGWISWWLLVKMVTQLVRLAENSNGINWKQRAIIVLSLLKWGLYGLWLYIGMARLALSPIGITVGFSMIWLLYLVKHSRNHSSNSEPVVEQSDLPEVHHGTI